MTSSNEGPLSSASILHGLLEATNAPLAILDREGRVLRFSRAMEALTGVELESMVYRRMAILFPDAEAAALEERRRRVLEGETVTATAVLLSRGGAGRTLVEAHEAPLRGPDGQIVGTALTLVNVTEGFRAVERLEDTERRFRAMADSAPVLLWMSRADGLCVFFNESWLRFTGRSLAEESGVGWAEGVHFEDLQRCLDTYYDAFNQRRTFEMEYRLRRHDGEFRWLLDRGMPRFDEEGRFVGYIGSCVDITDRRQAEQALRASEARLSAIVRTAEDAIVGVDENGTIDSCNPAAERIFGYTAAETIGMPVGLLIEESAVASLLAPRLVQGAHASHDTLGRCKDGRKIPLEVSVNAVVHGRRTLIMRDVSERRSLERQVLENGEQIQARIGQDLHDGLGQLLTGIAFLAKGLETRLPAEQAPQAARMVALINDAIGQVKTLAKGLSPLHLEKRGLIAVLEELVNDTQSLFAVECSFSAEPGIDTDSLSTRTQLYLITREALTNAVHHGRAQRLAVRLARAGSHLELSITDDGKGITSGEAREGLGLPSMRYRARMIGGFLDIGPASPRGTVVRCIW